MSDHSKNHDPHALPNSQDPTMAEQTPEPISLGELVRSDPAPPPGPDYWRQLEVSRQSGGTEADVVFLDVESSHRAANTGEPGYGQRKAIFLSVAACLLAIVGFVGFGALNGPTTNLEVADEPSNAAQSTPTVTATADPGVATDPQSSGAVAQSGAQSGCGTDVELIEPGELIDFDGDGTPELVASGAVAGSSGDMSTAALRSVYRLSDMCAWQLLARVEDGPWTGGGVFGEARLMCAIGNAGTRQLVALREYNADGVLRLEANVHELIDGNLERRPLSLVENPPEIDSIDGLGVDWCGVDGASVPAHSSMAAIRCGGDGYGVTLPDGWHTQIVGGATCREFSPVPFSWPCIGCTGAAVVEFQGFPDQVSAVPVLTDEDNHWVAKVGDLSVPVRERLFSSDQSGSEHHVRSYTVPTDTGTPLVVNTAYPVAWSKPDNDAGSDAFQMTYIDFTNAVEQLIEGFLPQPPEPAGRPAGFPVGVTYTAVQGDTVWMIADRFGVTVADFMAANDLDDPSQLAIGQRLVIPGGLELPPPPPPPPLVLPPTPGAIGGLATPEPAASSSPSSGETAGPASREPSSPVPATTPDIETSLADPLSSSESRVSAMFTADGEDRTLNRLFRASPMDDTDYSACFDRELRVDLAALGFDFSEVDGLPPADFGKTLESSVDALFACVNWRVLQAVGVDSAVAAIAADATTPDPNVVITARGACFAAATRSEKVLFASDLKLALLARELGDEVLPPESATIGCIVALTSTLGLQGSVFVCNGDEGVDVRSAPTTNAPSFVTLLANRCELLRGDFTQNGFAPVWFDGAAGWVPVDAFAVSR